MERIAETYDELDMVIIRFDSEDVIVTSPNGDPIEGGEYPNG